MNEILNSNNLDIYEQALIMSSIDLLIPDLPEIELNPQKREAVSSSAYSVLEKLEKQETSFSSNEIFLMYLAVNYFRDTISDIISTGKLSDSDWEESWDKRRAAIRVIRKIKASYNSFGRVFDDDFDLGPRFM